MLTRLITVTIFLAFGAGAYAKTPNIVMIMADDIGYECFGCYGSEQYQTPRIDEMAAQGMRFDQCHAQPLCTPSRVKLMTGISNVRNYSAFSVLNRDQTTFGHMLKDAGYKTFVGGKWQLYGAEHYDERFRGKGTMPEDAGFDDICLWQVDKQGERYWSPLLYINGTNRQFSEDDFGPNVVTDHLLRFMEAQREGPFFVYYPMILVHNPFVPTPLSESSASKDRQRNFEDMVRSMDQIIGRIIDKTKELGIAEETLIMFVGDNGTNKAITSVLHGKEIVGGKGLTTDAGTRVPFVAYMPGTVPAGEVCGDLVDFSDFVPTMREFADLPKLDGLDGHSFAPQLCGQTGTPREWMYCFYHPRPERGEAVRFVRDLRWKLYGDGKFVDVANDPLEKEPIKQPSSPEALAAKQKLQQALDSMPAKGQTLLKFAP